MKILIICQGEGRGHITQCLSFFNTAKEQGHDVRVFVSKNSGIPDYADVMEYKQFESLNYYINEDGGINSLSTFFMNLMRLPLIIQGALRLKKEYKLFKPDKVVSFYETMGGLLFKGSTAIAHQYKFLHPDYKFPKNPIKNHLLQIYTALTCLRSKEIYALSWYKMRDIEGIKVIPPILRKDAYQPAAEQKDFILSYTRKQFTDELIEWGGGMLFKLMIYYDGDYRRFDNIEMLRISDTFPERLRECYAYISNAGFESIAEALMHNKPIYVSPIPNQYEQVCNANDLVRNKLGNSGSFSEVQFDEGVDVSEWIKSGENICNEILK